MRARIRIALPVAAVALWIAAGCRTHDRAAHDDPSLRPYGVAHVGRFFTLNPDAPDEAKLRVHLVRVDPDGTVVINVRGSETFSAKPGEAFRGAFGERGLSVSKSDPATQTATLMRMTAEPI
jgi:hypothetical protein